MKVEMRVRLVRDHNPRDSGVSPEMAALINSGTLGAYGILVEYKDQDGDWLKAAAVWGHVAATGFLGAYSTPSEIMNDGLREKAKDVWAEAVNSDTVRALRNKPGRKPRLIINAGEIRDMWESFKFDTPYPMRLADGTEIEVVAGDPVSGEIGATYANLDEIEVRGTSL